MKKQFLTLALLATVAVGGAFAGNASTNSKRLLNIGGPYNSTTCNNNVNCTTAPGTPACTFSGVTQYTQQDGSTGKCTRALYQIIL